MYYMYNYVGNIAITVTLHPYTVSTRGSNCILAINLGQKITIQVQKHQDYFTVFYVQQPVHAYSIVH